MLKRKSLPTETVQYLGRDHRPTPHRVTAKMAFFSWEKSIPGNSTDHLAFSWNRCSSNSWLTHRTLAVFLFCFLRDRTDKCFRLNRRRAESTRSFRKKVIFRASFLKKKSSFFISPKYYQHWKSGTSYTYFSSNTEERTITMLFPSRGSVELEERGSQTRLLHISGSKRR